MVGWYLEQQSSNGLRIGLTGATAMSLGIAVFLSFISDLGISEVQATDECIARATYGHDFGGSMWRYQDMTQVTFIPRGRSGKPFGLLILMMQANIVILGVPDQMPGSDVIKFFKHRGVREAQITVL